jgi:hypothetical protein
MSETGTEERGGTRDMRRSLLLLVGALVVLFVGCSSGGDTVSVVLSEFVVQPDPTTASAGEVTFEADNQGAEIHELVIVRADSAESLPTDETGKVNEDGLSEGAFIGEIEEFESGTTESATFVLEAGTYVLFCNITEEEEDGTTESHFQEGMHTTFTVEE